MNKEISPSLVGKNIEVIEDFLARKYHPLAEFLDKNKMGHIRCAICVVVLISISYLMISMLMMIVGTMSYLILEHFYDMLWFDSKVLPIIWIFFCAILIVTSVFGIVGAFQENASLTNIFGDLLLITLVVQILPTFGAFCLIDTGGFSYNSFIKIDGLMKNYYESSFAAGKMDWIQNTFKCCGGEYPSDWDAIEKRRANHSHVDNFNFDTLKYKTPESCCTEESGYQNMTCDYHYPIGCTAYIREFVSDTILIIGRIVVAMAVIQILGMISAFTLATMIKRIRPNRNVQIWNVSTSSNNVSLNKKIIRI